VWSQHGITASQPFRYRHFTWHRVWTCRQVAGDRLKICVRACLKRQVEPIVKLGESQPALLRRLAQRLGYSIPIVV
jgi:hypothetical protein